MDQRDHSELIGVLESLLGPAVAAPGASAGRQVGHLTGAPVGPREPNAPAPISIAEVTNPPTRHGVTEILSAESPVGIAVLDAAQFIVLRANEALLTLLGEAALRDNIVGRRLREVAPGLAHSEVEAAFARVARTGHPFSAIIEQEHPEGPSYLRCSLSPIRHADGTFTDLLLTLLDATEQMEARHRAERESQRAEEHALRTGVRSFAVRALARVSDLNDALTQVTERTAEMLGDCCAVLLLGEDDVLELAALHDRDAAHGADLRRAYAAHQLRRGEGIAGQVVLGGNGILASQWGLDDAALVAPALRAAADAAQIASLACAPLREAARTFGVIVLFSRRAPAGGSGRTLTGADLATVQELADEMALAVQNVRLREALRTAQAEKGTLLELSGEGVAIYDAQGRLRHLNDAGRHLLSHPGGQEVDESEAARSPSRRLLSWPDEAELAQDDLPWARALRGERVGGVDGVPVLAVWDDGARRLLRVRALPVGDPAGEVSGVVATLIEAQSASAAGAGTSDTIVALATPAPPDATTAADAEWARWRETMELLDDGVVLCDADGAAVFINAAGKSLLNLAEDVTDLAGGHVRGDVWAHVRGPDGAALESRALPVSRALAGDAVRDMETAVLLAGGALRRIFWDARRVARGDDVVMGVVLIARAADETSPGAAVEQETVPHQGGAPGGWAVTTRLRPRSGPNGLPADALPGPYGAVADVPTNLLRGAGEAPLCDLAETCAQVARGHEDAQGRRLEIRLPRRRVLIEGDGDTVARAIHALIASAAAALPRTAPLHVAVWVERGRSGLGDHTPSAIPPAMDAEQLETVLLGPGQLPSLTPPTRVMARAQDGSEPIPQAMVRVCSPNVRAPAPEGPSFQTCRGLAAGLGGRAWAREDPVLGPTYFVSVPLVELPAGA
ncbi:MAG TPA: PAS domain-containing protein [Ktedonobacterales bacterium]